MTTPTKNSKKVSVSGPENKFRRKFIKFLALGSGFILLERLGLGLYNKARAAWVNPSADPPGGNIGPLQVGSGGTGLSSATDYGVVIGGAASEGGNSGPFQVVSPGTAGYVLTSAGASANPTFTSVGNSASITIKNPHAGGAQDDTIFYTNTDITISEMDSVIVGGSSVTWTVRHSTDRNATGNEVVMGGTATASTTTGTIVNTFDVDDDDPTIPASSFVWLETTAQGGGENELHVTLYYDLG